MSMREYVLHYFFEVDGQEIEAWYRCQADDYDHAVEQLLDDDAFKVVFYELYKGE